MSVIAEEHLGVVVVDDDAIFRNLIVATVKSKSNFVMFEAASSDELLHILKEQKIDCILLDYDLGVETGFSIKHRVEEFCPNPPPSIMMTGDGRESTAIKAFRLGVADYLPKRNLCAEAVVKAVINVVENDRQDQHAKLEHARLVEASRVDLVTGLESRPQLDERLAHLAALSQRTRRTYALILVEIAEFRSHTERLGLKATDQILRTLGKQLQTLIRSNDICGRYSAETFLVIADIRADRSAFDALCQKLAANMPRRFSLAAADLNVAVRIVGGFCQGGNCDQTSGHDLIEPLLKALEQARSIGSVLTVVNETTSALAITTSVPSLPGAQPAPGDSDPVEPRPAADLLRSVERRRTPRQRVFRRGLIHIIGNDSTINCVVRNISTSGAGLRLEAPCAVPEVFDLEVVGSGRKRTVHVQWQLAGDLGVEFHTP